MIKVIIIDDEVNVWNIFKIFLGVINKFIEIIGEVDDILFGIKLIRNSELDLIFLDIKLKSGISFEFLV